MNSIYYLLLVELDHILTNKNPRFTPDSMFRGHSWRYLKCGVLELEVWYLKCDVEQRSNLLPTLSFNFYCSTLPPFIEVGKIPHKDEFIILSTSALKNYLTI